MKRIPALFALSTGILVGPGAWGRAEVGFLGVSEFHVAHTVQLAPFDTAPLLIDKLPSFPTPAR